MDNDLNTPQAIATLFDLAREINRSREAGLNIGEAQETLRGLGSVLGLTFEETTPYFQRDAVVAEYAEVLRKSHWAQGSSLAEVKALVEQLNDLFPDDRQVAEFAELVARSEDIAGVNPS